VGTTVENADRLLDIWIKVLSQSEHTQKLLLDEKWQGSTEVISYLFLYVILRIRMQEPKKNCFVLNRKLLRQLLEQQNSLVKRRPRLPKKQNLTQLLGQQPKLPHIRGESLKMLLNQHQLEEEELPRRQLVFEVVAALDGALEERQLPHEQEVSEHEAHWLEDKIICCVHY
jgi:hypothetical protein